MQGLQNCPENCPEKVKTTGMERGSHDNVSCHDVNLLSGGKEGRSALRIACVEIGRGENACLPML